MMYLNAKLVNAVSTTSIFFFFLHWFRRNCRRIVLVQCTTRYNNTRYKDSLDITTIFPVIFLICSVRVVISSKFTALDIRNTAWAEKLPSAAVGQQKFGQPKKIPTDFQQNV
jgi:hypothetical protein